MRTLVLCALTAFLLLPAGAFQRPGAPDGQASLTTFIIVRHAEKETSGDDPPLTEAGRRRARGLAGLLAGTSIDALIASPRRRTRETLAPVAAMKDLPVTIIPLGESVEAHAAELLDTVLTHHAGRTVLVASHSNVIPVLLRKLGITTGVVIGDDEYDDVFIITAPSQKGESAAMLRLTITAR